MAYSTIIKPTDYFNTKLYTGNGSTNAQTGVGFQPDWVWLKGRSNTGSNKLMDAVRGSSSSLCSNNSNAAEGADYFSSFDSDGFTVATTSNDINANGQTYVGWNWKAGTTSGIATDGSSNITPSGYSFNTTSKFSVIKWSGTGVDGAYLPHGLGVAPSVAIIKKTSASEEWVMFHIGLGTNARQEYLRLNNSAAKVTTSGIWYSQLPTATNIRLSNDSWVNASGSDYVGYFFADTPGYQKHDSYVGNGNADGTFVYTGFKPAFIILKQTSSAGNDWWMFDSKRLGYNDSNYLLRANITNAEITNDDIDLVSNGFKIVSTDGGINASGSTYIYMAFAEEPLVANSGESVPTTAR